MGLLVNTYIFYADVYFIQNFIIKMTVLTVVVFSLKNTHQVSIRRIVVTAIGGNIFEIVGLMIIPNYTIFLLIVNLIEIPVMMLWLFGKRSTTIIKSSFLGYFFVILINGTLEALGNIFGGKGHFVSLLILSCIIVVLGILYFLNQKKIQKGIYEVELEHNGTKLKNYAYYDSGNCLKDPYTGKGVHIISEVLFNRLALKPETRVCVPYQALGNTEGILDVYYIENLRVHGEKDTIELQKIPLGVTKDELFKGRAYEMILNEEIW